MSSRYIVYHDKVACMITRTDYSILAYFFPVSYPFGLKLKSINCVLYAKNKPHHSICIIYEIHLQSISETVMNLIITLFKEKLEKLQDIPLTGRYWNCSTCISFGREHILNSMHLTHCPNALNKIAKCIGTTATRNVQLV